MVARQESCLRQLSGGARAWEVGAGRLLANRKVTMERLVAGWGAQTASAVCGRHVLALQDTSEINFRTTAQRQRGLGEIGKGVGRGVLAHVMLALDAGNGSCLGLVGGGTLSGVVAKWAFVDQRAVDLPATHKRAARKTVLSLRFGAVEVLRPDGAGLRDLPRSQKLRLVEVVERAPPAGVEPVHW